MDKAEDFSKYLGPNFQSNVDLALNSERDNTQEAAKIVETYPNQEQLLAPDVESKLKLKESLVLIGVSNTDFVDFLSTDELTSLQERATSVLESKQIETITLETKRQLITSSLNEVLPETETPEPIANIAASIFNGVDVSVYQDFTTASDLNKFTQEYAESLVARYDASSILQLATAEQVNGALKDIQEDYRSSFKTNYDPKVTAQFAVIDLTKIPERDTKTEEAKTEVIDEAVTNIYSFVRSVRDNYDIPRDKGGCKEVCDILDQALQGLTPFTSIRRDGIGEIDNHTPEEWIADIKKAVENIHAALVKIQKIDNGIFSDTYKERLKESLTPLTGLEEELNTAIRAYNLSLGTNEMQPGNIQSQLTDLFGPDSKVALGRFESAIKIAAMKHINANFRKLIRSKILNALDKLEAQEPTYNANRDVLQLVDELQDKHTSQVDAKREADKTEENIKELARISTRFKKILERKDDLETLSNGYLLPETIKPEDSEELKDRKSELNLVIDLIKKLKQTQTRETQTKTAPSGVETQVAAKTTGAKTQISPATSESIEIPVLQGKNEIVNPEINENGEYIFQIPGVKLSAKKEGAKTTFKTIQKESGLRVSSVQTNLGKSATVNPSIQSHKDGALLSVFDQIMLFTPPSSMTNYFFLEIDNKPVLLKVSDMNDVAKLANLVTSNKGSNETLMNIIRTALEV